MALTAKPITTISYNSEGFLRRKIEQLFESGKIEDYRYIFHYGEGEDKDHFHVILFPNRRLDTVELRNEFKEPIPTQEKPLGCMPFRTNSNREHWLMYVLHDPDYLRAHNSQDDGDGKIRYELQDIQTPFPEQLARDFKTAQRLKNTDNQKIIKGFEEGKNAIEVTFENNVNPSSVMAILNMYRLQSQMSNEARFDLMKEQIQQLQGQIAEAKQNEQTLMLRDLEMKTGEDLHSMPSEHWYDPEEEENKK